MYNCEFCFRLGKNASETISDVANSLQKPWYGKNSSKQFYPLKQGEMSIKDKSRVGHPSTSRMDENVDKVYAIVLENWQQTMEVILELSVPICSRWKYCFFHHDNAPVHAAVSGHQFLIWLLSSLPYSPDLAPCNNFCFHKWRRTWKEIVLAKWNR